MSTPKRRRRFKPIGLKRLPYSWVFTAILVWVLLILSAAELVWIFGTLTRSFP